MNRKLNSGHEIIHPYKHSPEKIIDFIGQFARVSPQVSQEHPGEFVKGLRQQTYPEFFRQIEHTRQHLRDYQVPLSFKVERWDPDQQRYFRVFGARVRVLGTYLSETDSFKLVTRGRFVLNNALYQGLTGEYHIEYDSRSEELSFAKDGFRFTNLRRLSFLQRMPLSAAEGALNLKSTYKIKELLKMTLVKEFAAYTLQIGKIFIPDLVPWNMSRILDQLCQDVYHGHRSRLSAGTGDSGNYVRFQSAASSRLSVLEVANSSHTFLLLKEIGKDAFILPRFLVHFIAEDFGKELAVGGSFETLKHFRYTMLLDLDRLEVNSGIFALA